MVGFASPGCGRWVKRVKGEGVGVSCEDIFYVRAITGIKGWVRGDKME